MALALDPADRAALEHAARRSAAAVRATVADGRATRTGRRQFPGATLPPQAADPLLGRDTDVAAIAAMVREPSGHLVTLTGPGGVGKTRLALRVARELEADFPDGVVFVPLAAVRDADLVVPTVAQALGVREVTGRALEEAIGRALNGRQVLIILDNCEQILAAAPAIGRLLGASPTVRGPVTSRAPLRLGSEQRYPVRPMETPHLHADATRDELARNPAVQLFVRRAWQVQPHFVLTSENAADVAAICRRMEGLPLAIELAAARTTVLSAAALLARLERALPLLSGGARDQPQRLQTMREAIAWSFDLLSPQDQRLFRELAISCGVRRPCAVGHNERLTRRSNQTLRSRFHLLPNSPGPR